MAIHFDPAAVAFGFTVVRPDRGTTDYATAVHGVGRPALGLTVADLMGLPEARDGLPDRQLALPLDFWVEHHYRGRLDFVQDSPRHAFKQDYNGQNR